MPVDALGTILSIGSSLIGDKSSSDAADSAYDAQVQAAQIAADSALPWDVYGAGGSATFNPDTDTGVIRFSDNLRPTYGDVLNRNQTWMPMISDLVQNPFGAQEALYQQMKSAYAPEQERQRIGMEERLLRQGLFGQGEGESGANPHMQALLEAQGMQDLNMRNNAMTQAQGLIDQYLSRQYGDIGQATGLLNVPLQYANLARGIGGDLSSGGQTAASLLGSAGVNYNAAQAANTTSMWDTISNTVPSLVDQFSSVFNQPAASTPTQPTAPVYDPYSTGDDWTNTPFGGL